MHTASGNTFHQMCLLTIRGFFSTLFWVTRPYTSEVRFFLLRRSLNSSARANLMLTKKVLCGTFLVTLSCDPAHHSKIENDFYFITSSRNRHLCVCCVEYKLALWNSVEASQGFDSTGRTISQLKRIDVQLICETTRTFSRQTLQTKTIEPTTFFAIRKKI